MKHALIMALLAAALVPLVAAMSQLPPFGSETNPTHIHVVPRYLEKGPEEAGAENIVTDVLLNYRGYDTNGEVTVIFTALVGVLAVLLGGAEARPRSASIAVPHSQIVVFVVKAIAPFTATFAIYLVLHGHLTPGGGFQGGTTFGALVALASLVLGRRYGYTVFPQRVRPWLQAAALIGFILVGLAGVVLYGSYLKFPAPNQAWLRQAWILIVEASIGLGGAAIIASLFWAMEGEP